MLQVCHVQEAMRPLWGSWWPVLVLHGPNSPCPIPQCPVTSNNHRCWDRTETVLWSDPVVVPDHGAAYQCSWLFLGCSRSRDTWWFCPMFFNTRCVQSGGRQGLEQVGTWFFHLALPGKDALNRTETPYSTVFFLYFLGWAILSIFSWEDREVNCRFMIVEWVFLVLSYLAQNSTFLISICFLLNFLPYKGNIELYKWATEYEHISFEVYFSDY